jgi:hypothetical protein
MEAASTRWWTFLSTTSLSIASLQFTSFHRSYKKAAGARMAIPGGP